MVVVAELEIFHSRPIAPTRRVALGRALLPCDPPPGFGGLLLGAIVAAHAPGLDADLLGDLNRLTVQLEQGQRIPQPRLRYRFQSDTVGLLRSRHRLLGDGESLSFALDEGERATPVQHVLGAVYAAGSLEPAARRAAMTALRRGMRWVGPVDDGLVAALSGTGAGRFALPAFEDPVRWALDTLGLKVSSLVGDRSGERPSPEVLPARQEVVSRYRHLLREAHPDHGGEAVVAAARIAELTEARRILLAAT